MDKNQTQQYDNYSLQNCCLEPVTLSFNKRLLDHKKNETIFNKSMKKVPQLEGSNENQQLLSQLYCLLGNDDVRKNMTEGLHQRVQKIIAAAQVHQGKQNPLNQINKRIKQQGIQNFNNQQNKSLKMKQGKNKNWINSQIPSQNLFSLKKGSKENKQNIEHRGTFNLSHHKKMKKVRGVETQCSESKQKQQRSNKKLKSFESQKCFKYMNVKKIREEKISNEEKKNRKHLKKENKQISEQKSAGNTIHRQQSNSKYPYSLNTTVFTTRNMQIQIKNSKQKSSKTKSLLKLTKSKDKDKDKGKDKNKDKDIDKNKNKDIDKNKDKGSKMFIEQRNKSNFKLRKHLTEVQNFSQKTQNRISQPHTCSDEQLLGKEKKNQFGRQNREDVEGQGKFYRVNESPIQSHNILEQTCSFQFIDRIHKLQRNAIEEQQQLQLRIRQLKNLISVEKYNTQNSKSSIFKLKEQQNNMNVNTAFIFNKKKEVHKKLQSLWLEVYYLLNQVKSLNISILQINKQNSQIMSSVEEEKQLIEMYTTVIQQLRQQLKIQIDERDQFKKKVQHSRKNEMAAKMKASCTKEKTQLIMGNIRESMNKWIS